jgi:modulator of FtsH protease
MGDWNTLFAVTSGSAATLAGLIFVGLSINLDKLVRTSGLLMGVAAALALLAFVIGISILLLIPEQSMRVDGIEVLGMTIVASFIVGLFSRRSILRSTGEHHRYTIMLSSLRVAALVPWFAGGILLIGRHDAGMDLLVLGFLIAFVVSIGEAWVVLVEMDREREASRPG